MRPISALLGGGGTGYSHPIWTIDGGSELCAEEAHMTELLAQGVSNLGSGTCCKSPTA